MELSKAQLKRNLEHSERRLAHLHQQFMQLWQDERTMRLRYTWLETAATDVVTACPEHLAGQLDELREELGIETKETENGNTEGS